MSSIARPFSTSFCHLFHFFCLLSLVFLAPIYANLLWNCFRRAESCWGVGMPGMRPEWRQIELQPHPSVSRLIDCAIEARATERERERENGREGDRGESLFRRQKSTQLGDLSRLFFYTLAEDMFTLARSLQSNLEDISKAVNLCLYILNQHELVVCYPCLSFYLSIYLSNCLFACLSVRLSVRLFVFPSVHLLQCKLVS